MDCSSNTFALQYLQTTENGPNKLKAENTLAESSNKFRGKRLNIVWIAVGLKFQPNDEKMIYFG